MTQRDRGQFAQVTSRMFSSLYRLLLNFKPRHPTSVFAAVIMTSATRGRLLTGNVSMCHDELLSQSTYRVAVVMQMGGTRLNRANAINLFHQDAADVRMSVLRHMCS